MLEFLKINNVALIKDIELSLHGGFNVILGETGAGKSIIIDALNFVLGEKADRTLIRAGEELMKVYAKFVTKNKGVLLMLDRLGIACEDGEILLSRTYSQSGKNDARINGEIVSISTLKELGSALVDAYSQNESVSLLKQKNHLAILDSYKPLELKELKSKIESKIEKVNKVNQEIKNFGGSKENRERQIDILKYQIAEIEEADIKVGEEDEISEVLDKLSHSEKILSALTTVNQFLNSEEDSVVDALKSSIRTLSSVEMHDDKIMELNKGLSSVALELEDICESFFGLGEEYDFDEAALDRLIFRRDKLSGLKKKYGSDLDKVSKFLDDAREELDRLENAEESLALKEKEKKELLDDTLKLMLELGQIRRKHAKEIEEKVVAGLAELGILKARFNIKFFSKTESIYHLNSYNLNSLEDVEFLFSANYGEDLKPLAKTISGGEMSRFMLVFKNIIAEVDGAETLIFDEIDTGISGKTANSVALKIAKLSKEYQIVCITHSSQIASMADSFYYVSKGQSKDRTETQIKSLNNNEVINELALLSYGKIDENSLRFAQNMLSQNKQIKLNIE